MTDLIKTHCPHCGTTPNLGSQYAYRVIELKGTTRNDTTLPAVEIYCTSCNRTLSLTPLIPERKQ